MARGKKKETLTPEERLQAALVPEGEQPYPVPGNWCWVYAPSMFNIEYGKGLPTKKLCEDGYPVFGANGQIGFYNEYMFEDEKALMSCRGAYSGTMNLSLPKSFITNNSLIIETKLADISVKFVFYLYSALNKAKLISGSAQPQVTVQAFNNYPNSLIIETKLADISVKFVFYLYSALNKAKLISGSAQPQVTVQAFNNYPIPVPPLAEQQRIVDRIESLFSKLDEAKQKAQDALDSFETRKAAILHKAFTGELTAQWRKEHGIGMDSWERLKLGEIGTLERGRSQHRPRNDPRLFGGPYPFIQTGDVASANVYITEHHQTLSEFGMEQSRMFSAGTLCITIAANIGDVAILSYDCCFPDSVVGFIPNNRSISKFVYYMMSVLQKELEDNAPATAQKNINLKILNAVEMNIPPVIEQTEIIRMLDGLLAKEQQAKEAAEGVLEQIDLIKKAILARAFRGDLGTNDPSEESAVELLKQILSC